MINPNGILLSILISVQSLTVVEPDYENTKKTFVVNLNINKESVVIDVDVYMGYVLFLLQKNLHHLK